jgi:hypothetical protein
VGKPSSRFTEEEQADFIAWYYSDQTSYLLKPLMSIWPETPVFGSGAQR